MASSSQGGQSYYRMSVAFEQSLGAPLLPRIATIGRFLQPAAESVAALATARAPPPAPCLACGSTGQRIIIHNNNSHAAAAKRSAKLGGAESSGGGNSNSEEATVQVLKFGREPTAICAGQLSRDAAAAHLQMQDALLFGSATSILAFDVGENKQLFYKDVEDGVRAVVSGPVPTTDCDAEAPVLAIVGGNCSVFGFDNKGAERYWTVTGDQVTAMALVPWSGNRPSALLTASEDCEIRIFEGEEAVGSIMEVDQVIQLVPSSTMGRFAYLLDNGTVGVYQHTERQWRIKSKCKPVSAAFCDVDCDGTEELVVGYDNGRIEVRSDVRSGSGNSGGEVLFRDTYSAPIASVLAADYRQDGRVIPLVCTVDGMVRGLTLLESRMEDAEDTREAQALEALAQKKRMLAAQLASLETQLSMKLKGEEDTAMPEAGLEVRHTVRPHFQSGKAEIVFTVHHAPSDVVIQSCTLTANHPAFGDETDCVCFYADTPSSQLVCSVNYPRDVETEVKASIVVGSAHATSYQIHDLVFTVPMFIAYQMSAVLLEADPQLLGNLPNGGVPSGFVKLSFKQPLRMAAIEAWMRRAFSIPAELSLSDASNPDAPVLHVELLSMRGYAPLTIEVHNKTSSARHIIIRAEAMEHCGAVVSALSTQVEGGLVEGEADALPCDTRCEFPQAMEKLQEIVKRVEETNAIRQKLSTDMADAATIVKTLLIRAEDARLLGDMLGMRRTYTTLHEVDRELIGENMKRVNNYEDLKASLKEINSFIQRAGTLRVGSAKTEFIAACRSALKMNRADALVSLIRTGEA